MIRSMFEASHRLFLGAGLLAAALAAPAHAQDGEGQAQGLGNNFSGLQLQGDQPISIEANELNVDDNEAVAIFTGDVNVSQGATQLRTGKLVVAYKRSGEEAGGEGSGAPSSTLPGGSDSIERLEASQDVYVKSADQVATASRGTFDMATQRIVMTGDVVLTQGENVAEGCRLTIQADTGQARLESSDCEGGGGNGRVRLMLSPGSQPGGAATN